jgi:hypothetical protein
MVQRVDAPPVNTFGAGRASPETVPASLEAPSPVFFSGSPEAALATAMAEIDRARQRETALGAEAQQQRLDEREHAIDDREEAARKKLAAGILGGIAKACEGAASLAASGSGAAHGAEAPGGAGEAAAGATRASGKAAQWTLLGARTGLDAVAQGLAHGASRSTTGGERHDLRADAFEQAARRAESSRQEAQQVSSRLLDGIGEIERLRHEASTAALRG